MDCISCSLLMIANVEKWKEMQLMKEFKQSFMSWKILSILVFLLSLFLAVVLVKDFNSMSRFISCTF